MLAIRDLESKTIRFESLLQRISTEILAKVSYERVSPEELLAKSETDVSDAKKLAEEMKDIMLLLKPERASSVRRAQREFAHSINSFFEVLKKRSETRQNVSKQALDYLRKAVTEGQEFVELARSIIKDPSKMILEILRLKEISEAKDYLSKVSIPETVYARLEYLRKSIENLRMSLLRLEQSVQEFLKQLNRVEEEILKFQQA
ncbi:hypothetical protein KEJ29_05740 [Candidatus Bathyarchaeota archaeon]|nr:hypothetical protein [Candidatus Bathyarchaeota archaeon]